MTNNEALTIYDAYAGEKCSKPLFRQRIARLDKRKLLDTGSVYDAMKMNKHEYVNRYRVRNTFLSINGDKVCVKESYQKFSNTVVSYEVYRDRLSSISEKMSKHKISEIKDIFLWAAMWEKSRWELLIAPRTSYFEYNGKVYTSALGKRFLSLWHFLLTIGKQAQRKLVRWRLKSGWPIDRAINEQRCSCNANGLVYMLKSIVDQKSYIGITTVSLEQRLSEHVYESLNGTRLINKEIRKNGLQSFEVTILKNGLDEDELKFFEKKFIAELKTKQPNGFNMTDGGELAKGRGRKLSIGPNRFHSIREASEWVVSMSGHKVAQASAEARIRKLLGVTNYISSEHITKLLVPSRKHSKHPKAGTWLWRIWLRFKNKNLLSPRWKTYDIFELEVLLHHSEFDIKQRGLALTRPEKTKSLSESNFAWMYSAKVRSVM